ncbi:extracellular solute-binding protein [Microlunatus elymi]|uniref:Extracellular solute-binding protein n=1 Tax=Microlunatus elymi TaxID=2596828 RepID=A0A516PY90_9ACTN|nr:extracellular solute-binding protein [Microlunatus elymi]QDP96138.1 extracellular solute-binding protein [Microlunatus elymi]
MTMTSNAASGHPSAIQVSRRHLLAGGIAAGLGIGTLAGCSDPTKEANTAERNVGAKLPTYTPVDLVQPDLPGNEVLMSGYYTYPRHPKRVFDKPPASGLDQIKIMYPTFVPTPPGASKNKFYAQFQDNVGCTLNIRAISSPDYPAAFQTTIAGGDVPDLCMFPRPTPDEPRVMNKLFCDLGPYLAGDAVKDFPYLAAMPPDTWRMTVSNGSVYAVPQPRPVAPQAIFVRLDLAEQLGLNPEPGGYDEFHELMRGFTDKKARRWASASPRPVINFIGMMLGAPNNWSEEGGKFTYQLADERCIDAIQRVAGMVKEGLFHPDSASIVYDKIRTVFYAGQTGLLGDGAVGWDLFVRQLGGPVDGAKKLGMINAPKENGGGDARHYAGTSVQAVTVIKKDLGEDKTRKILNFLNFLATPIGSREHLERKYGVEGSDFTWVDGLPTLTKMGTSEFMDVQYITDSMTTIGPGPKLGVDRQYAWHKRASADPLRDPTVGLYSDTYSRKGATLNELINNATNDVIYGRKPISTLTDAYQDWRKKGGDKIAAEFAESLAAESKR